MSYSQLIQKDNPTGFWSLDEKSGTTAYGNGFIVNSSLANNTYPYTKLYDGSYSSSVNGVNFKYIFPMIYGGSSSVSILNSSAIITIPSLNKMSLKDCGNSSSIEFWIKVDTTSSTEQIIMWKGVSSSNPEVKISLLNDYVVYTLGTSVKQQSVAVHIDSINKPLHIVATYSKTEISLIVNGVMKSEMLNSYKTYFPSTYNSYDFKFQKPDGINILHIDSIAIYSYALSRQQALKHFVYGSGYNIPTSFVDSNNGVYYNFSMDSHQAIKKYEFGGANPWSITDVNNCAIVNNELSIIPKKPPLTLFKDNYGSNNDIDALFLNYNGSEYVFNENSYLQLSHTEDIIPNIDSGWAFKFRKPLPYKTTDQTLFYFASEDTTSFIKFVLTSQGIKCYVNTLDTYTSIGPSLISSMPEYFYVGFYIVDNYTINFIYLPESGSPSVISYSPGDDLSFINTFLRIGSDEIWNADENYETTSALDANVSSFTLRKIIAIHLDNTLLYSTYAQIEGSDFKHYYTISPDYLEKRFKVKSYGEASINIALQSLVEPGKTYSGASRLEIGNPYGNSNVSIAVSGTTYIDTVESEVFQSSTVISDRIITSSNWLNKYPIASIQNGQNISDLLEFNIILKTDDLMKKPTKINYFRLFSYPVISDNGDKYLNCNASLGGNPAKIYYRNSEYSVPDLQEYPFFYNGNKSGIKVKDSYIKITQDYAFPKKTSQVTAAQKGTSTIFTVTNNKFIAGDKVFLSGVYNLDGTLNSEWNFYTPLTISSVSGNDITVPLNSSSFSTYVSSSDYQGSIKTSSGIQTVSFMCYIPSTTTSANIIKIGSSYQLSLSGTTLSTSSGVTKYINGSSGSTIKNNAWNHITLIFNPHIAVNDLNPVDIILGSTAGTSEFYIDQLMLFDKLFTEKNITNLYNLFSGDITYKFYSNGPVLVDNSLDKTVTESTQKCIIINSTDSLENGSWIYTNLQNKTGDTTLTLTYKDSSKAGDVQTTLSRVFTNLSNSMYVTASNNLKVGSFFKFNNIDTNYSISTIDSGDIRLSPTAVSGYKNRAKLTFLNNIKINDLSEGDTVSCSGIKNAFQKDAKISKIEIGSTHTNITIISSVNANILIATATNIQNHTIIFKRKAHKITFNNSINLPSLDTEANIQKLDKNSVVVFDNYSQKENITENSKIFVNGSYLVNGDYILLYRDSNKKLFKISSLVDTEIYDLDKSVDISFDFIREFDSISIPNPDPYADYVFINNYELNISIKNGKAYKWTESGVWEKFDKFSDDRVQSFILPKSQE